MAQENKPKGEKKPKVKKPKEEKKVDENPTATEQKPKEEEKKSEGSDDKKKGETPPPPSPSPSPPTAAPEIVLKVFMHCEGCARKVRKSLKGFDGIKEVTTDCKTHKVVVTGEKADPLKVLDRLQKKTHLQVDLLSPIPPPPVEEAKKPEEKEPPKPPEPKVVSVVLKVHMHCEACSLEIKRRIERMKEVVEAIPDLQNSQVSVKGTFDPSKLVEYVYKRTGRHATLVNQDPPPPEKDDNDKGKAKGKGKNKGKDKDKDGKEEKKEEPAVEEKKVEEKNEEPKKEAEGGGGGGDAKAVVDKDDGPATAEEGAKIVEVKANEFQYYPPSYAMEMYAYPPQIFSDENPNACSIM